MKDKINQALSSAINTTFVIAGIWAVIVIVLAIYFKSLLVAVLGALGIGSMLIIVFKIIEIIDNIKEILKE